MAKKPIIILGAGIVGASTAAELALRGEPVLLIDRQEPGLGASFGNMASIAVNGFEAVSRPAVWKKIPGWLADPVAPVAVNPVYAFKMLPWFLRFLAAGRPDRIKEIEEAGANLALRSLADLKTLLGRIGATDMLSDTACLQLFGTEAEFEAGRANLALMDHFGLKYEVLSGPRLREVEPLLNPALPKAVLLPDNHFVSSPHGLVLRLVEAMRAHGGAFLKGEVARLERDERGVTAVILTDGKRIETDRVLIAMGVHSRDLAKASGEPIPLETERGYHTQIMAPGVDLKWSLIWPERAFMITPTAGGVRVGGSVEMAGLERAPNWRRARFLVEHARYALPGLKVEEATEWMGHRPALPDTIPVLSASSTTRGLYYSTGHGHFGLTYCATTALAMADLMTDQAPPIDLTPYRINRY